MVAFILDNNNFSNPKVNYFSSLTQDYIGNIFTCMNVSCRIKQRMADLGMTQDELAKLAGVSQPAVFKLLSGKTRRTTRLPEIAAALKVSLAWLADGAEPMIPGADLASPSDKDVFQAYLALPEDEKNALRILILSRKKIAENSAIRL